MAKKLKTELTRDEVLKLLELYNSIDAMIEDTIDSMDVRLSHLSDLRDKAQSLSGMFDFRPVVGDDGHPRHWLYKVLPDAPDAWFYEELE